MDSSNPDLNSPAEICNQPNQFAPPPYLELFDQLAIFHGYQNFVLTKYSVTPLNEDHLLKLKYERLRPFFSPAHLQGRTLLDLGANSAFFCFWALQRGATEATAVDMDADYLRMIERASTALDIQGIQTAHGNISNWDKPADCVLALALVHWIYSCTSIMGTMEAIVRKLRQLTRHILIIEWVDPGDPAINFFHHLQRNQQMVTGPYSLASFETALAECFARVQHAGDVSSTRKLYVAFCEPHAIDMACPLPVIMPRDKVIYSRLLAEFDGLTYWSRIYDATDCITKQTSFDLASREAVLLTNLNGGYFPKVISSSADGTSSTLVMEKINGLPLTTSAAMIRSDLPAVVDFCLHCVNILEELKQKGILHRDIREENILMRDGKPVLIDFGWAVTEALPIFSPQNLGESRRPPDGSFCDVYSMGKVLEYVSQKSHPSIAGVVALMTQADASERTVDLSILKTLFTVCANLIHGREPESIHEAALRHLLEQISRASSRLTLLKSVSRQPGEQQLQQEQALHNLALHLSEKTQALQSIEALLRERDGYVADLREQIVGRDRHAANLQEQVIERDRHIEHLHNQLVARDSHVVHLQNRVLEREQIIAELRGQLDAQPVAMAGEVEAGEVGGAIAAPMGSERAAPVDSSSRSAGDERQAINSDERIVELQSQLQSLKASLEEKEQLLHMIYRGRLYKVIAWVWRMHAYARDLKNKLPLSLKQFLPKLKRFVSDSGSTDGAAMDKTPSAGQVSPQGISLPAAQSYDIICFPVIDWEFRFQRPQQLMTQFAKQGHRVFYVATQFQNASSKIQSRQIADRIYGIQLPGSARLNLYQHELNRVSLDLSMEALDEFQKAMGLSHVVCIVQLPFWTQLAFAAKERWDWKVVYDCMDEHSGFSTNSSHMLDNEYHLFQDSDLVVVSAHSLYDKARHVARKVLLLNNAADYEHFSQQQDGDRVLPHVQSPIIGYYGAISDWFDVGMIYKAARARPQWNFVLIGHTFGADVSSLRHLDNVHLLGEMPYTVLPRYLHRFDVACIPFLLTPLTEATNPVKFYEYLSAGKPMVSVQLPELEPYGDLFYPAKTTDEFIAQIEIALAENSPSLIEKRQAFARKQTWAARHQVLDDEIKGLFGKVGIIVTSFRNPEYLKLCLQSLKARTLYPNWRVIVVDNASGQEVRDYLKNVADAEAKFQVILNEHNVGFARANNLAIQQASDCQFLVLLNDDTVVTRGWLTKLIGHLRNPEIGLIGPVTNWAGNEARIEVPYQEIDEMELFAEGYMSAHAGEVFDISVLAMFCVAMRRSLIEEIGLLDERFGIGMFEDDDFALRVRELGYRVVCAEDVFIHHWGRASFEKMDEHDYKKLFEENRRKFEEKWGKPWQPHQYRRG